MDLPLPDGPTIATNCPDSIVVVERMQDRERMIAALDRFGDVAQLDHRPGFSRVRFRAAARVPTRSSVSTMRAPSALGWMPSAMFRLGMPATPSR